MSEKVVRPANSLRKQRGYVFGDFRLDAVERVIKSAGQPLSVSPKALDVLVVLVENRGHLVEKGSPDEQDLAGDLCRREYPGL